jgi:hypothetical protein
MGNEQDEGESEDKEAELRNVVRDQFAPVRAAIDELEPCVGCAPRSGLFASVRARINALEECVLEVALTASHALRGMNPPSFQMAEAFQVPLAESVQAIEVTLEIATGQSRTRLFDMRVPYPKAFLCADDARVIDVECLRVTGPQRVDVQLVRGDMPQAAFSLWQDDPQEPRGAMSLRGMVVPARQGWDVFASREFTFNEPSVVTLRITQRPAPDTQSIYPTTDGERTENDDEHRR